MKTLLKIKIALSAIVIVAIIALVWWLATGTSIETVRDEKLEETPVEIERIRSIGQWEFLSVSDEELVDTVRHGIFGDDELARVYYGTLRLGIDLRELDDDWLTQDGDTLVAKLPPVKLLDENFIDEARTKSFVEDGKWTSADRAALTRKARRMMLKRCLTPANIKTAEDNASKQMQSLLEAMGKKRVRVQPHS